MPEALREKTLRLWWGISLLGLMASTWALWTPDRGVPRLPPMAWLLNVPSAIDYLLLALVAYGVLRLLVGLSGFGLMLAAIGVALLMLLDQLRWQPWAYHLLLVAVLMPRSVEPGPRAAELKGLRWLALSLYAYSAISKLNYAFAMTLGQQMLQTQLGWLGIDSDALPEPVRLALAVGMPLGELIVAVLLLVRPRLGVYCAAAFHLAVLLTLSPLGLGHSLGVLLWNALFAVHTWILFAPSAEMAETKAAGEKPAARRSPFRRVVLAAALLLPATHYALGFWDRWPSWGLYAPSGEQATLLVHRTVAGRLPEQLKEHTKGTGDEDWQVLSLADWTLAETGAPLYPQNRTVVGLTLALAQQHRWGDYVQLEVRGAANWLDGERTSKRLIGHEAIREQADTYRLNTEARSAPSSRRGGAQRK